MRKILLLIIIGFMAQGFAAEMALSKSGKKVILKNDGTWEYFDPSRHLDVSDIREESSQLRISVKYYDYQYYLDQKKMYWEGTGVEGKDLKDSIRSVPKGGLIQLLMPEEAVNTADPKTFVFKLKNASGKVFVTTEGKDSESVPSDDVGIMVLKEIPVQQKIKGGITLIVIDKALDLSFEFPIEIP